MIFIDGMMAEVYILDILAPLVSVLKMGVMS
jgi:hypothetical protein